MAEKGKEKTQQLKYRIWHTALSLHTLALSLVYALSIAAPRGSKNAIDRKDRESKGERDSKGMDGAITHLSFPLLPWLIAPQINGPKVAKFIDR